MLSEASIASSGGSSWSRAALTGTVAPGGYYLVQGSAGAGGTRALPAPDATGNLNLSATAGKVALTSTRALDFTPDDTWTDLEGPSWQLNAWRDTGQTPGKALAWWLERLRNDTTRQALLEQHEGLLL